MFPIIYSEEFLQHKTGAFHPERPERLSAIVAALENAPWADRIEWRSPTPPPERPLLDIITQVHPRDYVRTIEKIARRGGGRLDEDTPVSSRSYDIALLAVSAWLDGVDRVLETGEPAFVLARPPGHHALPAWGMGFCLLSNAAIAARYALKQFGVDRVAILDWDVHHGNGTQAIVETHPQIAYCSLHESPNYPGTGDASERGNFENVLNLPMGGGSTIAEYRSKFDLEVIPFLKNFRPDLLIVSAGYDANRADPLSTIALEPEDFGYFTDCCLGISRQVLFGLEGGYDLEALAGSVVSTIERCLTHSTEP
ncbi:MAG: histone deacetylase [Cyanobacteriota bacterium]|nr:histone deacetylase [Cyanobacteriota bacterium]